MSDWQIVLCIIGMAVITLLTRGFFLLPDQELPMPDWARQGLRYAPLAALTAVVAPELVMSQGHVLDHWQDARLFAGLTSTLYFFWRRGILGTIISGTAVMLALRIGLGW